MRVTSLHVHTSILKRSSAIYWTKKEVDGKENGARIGQEDVYLFESHKDDAGAVSGVDGGLDVAKK